ncbi:MAG: electron transfer flavoprotein subunit alpha/FixB family protein [Thermoguttaceae bacterium]|nr:electron transfer flavoprotein subunit alpha/FixB family protein [Thermoguttaceae bacterium]
MQNDSITCNSLKKFQSPDDIWILAEQRNGILQTVSFELLARAVPLAVQSGGSVHAVVIGSSLPDSELKRLIEYGADRVFAIESPFFEHYTIDLYSQALIGFFQDCRPGQLIAAATTFGRTIMPYLAMKLHTGLTADCTRLEMSDSRRMLQTRPAAGGNIMATIQCPEHRPQMATVRPHSCKPLDIDKNRQGEIIRIAACPSSKTSAVTIQKFIPVSEETTIQNATKIVAVGCGIKRAENLKPIQQFAKSIGAVLGATREVVDRGWLPYSCQIGLSGKTITPRLYIGLGVSGAIQHLAGMQTAEKIVAVNKDPDAPIFRVADFGIVGDLFDVLPLLSEMLQKPSGPSPV